jgi:serine/threonine protein kinase
MEQREFFTDYGEANRYSIKEVIGKGSYGVVCSAIDNYTGEKVAIKKINNVFEHVSDATRILREIKLLRLLKHPDIVEIKHIMLPPSPRDFKDIYVVFELMETDLHQVIKANDDLTPEHHQFFLYQMLRGLKYIHSAKVFHRDLKPKNILANSDCKLKICDFGLARPAFNDMPTTVFWTDYVDPLVQGARAVRQLLCQVQPCDRHLERGLHLCRGAAGQAAVPRPQRGAPAGADH